MNAHEDLFGFFNYVNPKSNTLFRTRSNVDYNFICKYRVQSDHVDINKNSLNIN
jgi:hypothetical protein